jgi:peptidase E
MVKLLLTSDGFKNPIIFEKFLEVVNKPASQITVFMVITSDREYAAYKNSAKRELVNLGLKESNIKVFFVENSPQYSDLKYFDVFYFCGGDTFYLLEKIRNTKLDSMIKKFVEEPGKVFISSSAGSIIAGLNTEIAKIGDDAVVTLEDFTGLGLVDVMIHPHLEEHEKSEVDFYSKKYKLKAIPLKDGQALLVIGKSKKVVE